MKKMKKEIFCLMKFDLLSLEKMLRATSLDELPEAFNIEIVYKLQSILQAAGLSFSVYKENARPKFNT